MSNNRVLKKQRKNVGDLLENSRVLKIVEVKKKINE